MNRLLVIVVLLLAVTCLVSGQAQTSPPPKPGPEVRRLGSFSLFFRQTSTLILLTSRVGEKDAWQGPGACAAPCEAGPQRLKPCPDESGSRHTFRGVMIAAQIGRG